MPQEKGTVLAMSDVQERLHILLDYWIEHNSEHEKEFRDWADKAASLSNEVAQQLQKAATKMVAVGNDLMKAREALTKEMEGH